MGTSSVPALLNEYQQKNVICFVFRTACTTFASAYTSTTK